MERRCTQVLPVGHPAIGLISHSSSLHFVPPDALARAAQFNVGSLAELLRSDRSLWGTTLEQPKTNIDVEAYVFGPSLEVVVEAIGTAIGALGTPEVLEDIHFFKSKECILVVQSSYGGSFSYFLRNCDRWGTDVEFARFIAKEVGGRILCDPGSSFPEVSPYSDTFLEIEDDKESLVEISD